MADLGAISQEQLDALISRPVASWTDYTSNYQLLTINTSDSITVTVTLDSVAQAYAIVSLYYRTNGKLIDKRKTDASGQVTFNNLDATDANKYFAVITLASGSHNAIIYDKL